MKLVIVESPTKKLTIQKYLGSDYKVEASIGHVRDLAMSGQYNLGVHIYDGLFTPTYEILEGKEKVVENLKKLSEDADFVYLASDPDREGEAISWHLSEVLNLDPTKFKRLEFHEITKHAIQDAVENPRDLNDLRIDAQEARRIIDRILGFRISYVLARDTGAPSAGRVQSATLRLIYDRVLEQEQFVPVTTYYVDLIVVDEHGYKVNAKLVDEKGERIPFESEEAAKKFVENLKLPLVFEGEVKEEVEVSSKPPFALSELYQVANGVYHYSTKLILQAAKQLFENGYITYPRTDSHRLAPEFINKTKEYIKEKYGEEYIGVAKGQKGNKGQDAHEALRPTDLSVTSADLPDKLSTAIVKRVYDLIYNRTVQSMMKPKIEHAYTYTFTCGDAKFEIKKNVVVFRGYTILEKEPKENVKYEYIKGKEYKFTNNIDSSTTTRPADYSEGSLVKKMEETGIGRPSTYATMVSTILDRGYIESDKGYLHLTQTGRMVAEYLMAHFPNTVVNIQYTSALETNLDEIENGNLVRLDAITSANDDFLKEFNAIVRNPDPRVLKTGETCPLCGGDLIIKHGKYGEFIGCSNHPNCHYIKPAETGEICPECGKPLIYKNGPTGKFIGCSGYPNCRYIKPIAKQTKFYRRKKQ